MRSTTAAPAVLARRAPDGRSTAPSGGRAAADTADSTGAVPLPLEHREHARARPRRRRRGAPQPLAVGIVGRQVASVSKYYGVPIVLWVDEINAKGTWGRVELPYVWPRVEGWIPLAGLARETDVRARRRRPVRTPRARLQARRPSVLGGRRDRHLVLADAARGTTW